jgi:hypothetical protein
MTQSKWVAARTWWIERGIGFLVTNSRKPSTRPSNTAPTQNTVQILTGGLNAGPMMARSLTGKRFWALMATMRGLGWKSAGSAFESLAAHTTTQVTPLAWASSCPLRPLYVPLCRSSPPN